MIVLEIASLLTHLPFAVLIWVLSIDLWNYAILMAIVVYSLINSLLFHLCRFTSGHSCLYTLPNHELSDHISSQALLVSMAAVLCFPRDPHKRDVFMVIFSCILIFLMTVYDSIVYLCVFLFLAMVYVLVFERKSLTEKGSLPWIITGVTFAVIALVCYFLGSGPKLYYWLHPPWHVFGIIGLSLVIYPSVRGGREEQDKSSLKDRELKPVQRHHTPPLPVVHAPQQRSPGNTVHLDSRLPGISFF